MSAGRTLHGLQAAAFALTAAGSLAACGAANTPESATTPAAEEATQSPASPPEPVAQTPAAPVYPEQAPAPQSPAEQTPQEPDPQQQAPPQAGGDEQTALEKKPPTAGGKEPEPTTVTITTLSKGRGVPAPTRDAYKQIRGLLEEQKNQSAVTNIETQRIGIEGEMRMCAEFRDRAQAEYTLEQIRKISAEVELLNVAEGPCPPTQSAKP